MSARSGRRRTAPAESSRPCWTRWPRPWARRREAAWARRPGGRCRPALKRAEPGALLQAMERVAEAREAAYGNVNPQILLAVLGEELAEVL